MLALKITGLVGCLMIRDPSRQLVKPALMRLSRVHGKKLRIGLNRLVSMHLRNRGLLPNHGIGGTVNILQDMPSYVLPVTHTT